MTNGYQCEGCKKFFESGDFIPSPAEFIMSPGHKIVGCKDRRTYCLSCSVRVSKLLDKWESGGYDYDEKLKWVPGMHYDETFYISEKYKDSGGLG